MVRFSYPTAHKRDGGLLPQKWMADCTGHRKSKTLLVDRLFQCGKMGRGRRLARCTPRTKNEHSQSTTNTDISVIHVQVQIAVRTLTADRFRWMIFSTDDHTITSQPLAKEIVNPLIPTMADHKFSSDCTQLLHQLFVLIETEHVRVVVVIIKVRRINHEERGRRIGVPPNDCRIVPTGYLYPTKPLRQRP